MWSTYRPIYLYWRVEGKDFVKAMRQELACAVLVLAELLVLYSSQPQRLNTFQQPEIHSVITLPGVSHSIYSTGVKEKK